MSLPQKTMQVKRNMAITVYYVLWWPTRVTKKMMSRNSEWRMVTDDVITKCITNGVIIKDGQESQE